MEAKQGGNRGQTPISNSRNRTQSPIFQSAKGVTATLKPVGLFVSSPGRCRFGKPWECGAVLFSEPRRGGRTHGRPLRGSKTKLVLIPGLRSSIRMRIRKDSLHPGLLTTGPYGPKK